MPLNIGHLENITLSGVADGYDAFLLAETAKTLDRDMLYIVSDGVSLQRTVDLLQKIAPQCRVLKLPAWDTVPFDRVSPNANIVAERISTLAELASCPESKSCRIIIASVGAVLQKLPPKKIFLNAMREVKVGGKLNFDEFIHYAVINGYNRVEQVYEPGEYAVRGDILDIFPVGTKEPLRIDLFDDEVEKIRTFDVMSQRSTGELSFVQNIEKPLAPTALKTSFMKRFLPHKNIWEWKTGCRSFMKSRYRRFLIICHGRKFWSGKMLMKLFHPSATVLPIIITPDWKP